MTSPRLPNGSREYLLGRAESLVEVIRACSEHFERWGARRIIPTAFVPLEELPRPEQAIRFTERETGQAPALRQDLTSEIRRIVDRELAHLPAPFKLYYMERVWVDNPDAAGRTKERLQTGVEWIGAQPGAEAGLLRLALDLVRGWLDEAPTLVLGHAGLRDAWLDALRPVDRPAAERALDQRNLSLWASAGDPRFPDLPVLTVRSGDELPGAAPATVRALVDELAGWSEGLPVDLVIDPLARAGTGYYSGLFFGLGSGLAHDPWLRGGRYQTRTGDGLPALGLTLDLDPLVEAAEQGRLHLPAPSLVLWTSPDEPPAVGGIRWLPADPGLADPGAWALAHGLAGIAVVEGKQIVIRVPGSGAILRTLAT